MDPLEVDRPALLNEQTPDHPVAPPRVLFGEPGHPGDQLGFEVWRRCRVAVGQTVLPYDLAGPTFADLELLHRMRDGVPAASRAQTFPRLRSFNIEMSIACSATIRFSRAFSCSSVLSRIASSSFIDPYNPPPPVERLLRTAELLTNLRDRRTLPLNNRDDETTDASTIRKIRIVSRNALYKSSQMQ
jgi:hypothetical protein